MSFERRREGNAVFGTHGAERRDLQQHLPTLPGEREDVETPPPHLVVVRSDCHEPCGQRQRLPGVPLLDQVTQVLHSGGEKRTAQAAALGVGPPLEFGGARRREARHELPCIGLDRRGVLLGFNGRQNGVHIGDDVLTGLEPFAVGDDPRRPEGVAQSEQRLPQRCAPLRLGGVSPQQLGHHRARRAPVAGTDQVREQRERLARGKRNRSVTTGEPEGAKQCEGDSRFRGCRE